ncbi:unnamed protein product [Bursaphelenchus xylophilus]|uniref:(pine wood nematode) hypothetical protein n=1 Tax=Bursaphelenchus xylophilus TaxID=6326 RepID=A0A1I7S9J7_BURXY|nr:unnamed protein product [Bursaphelenchus xylophilus]CAG9111171.1 unnamed protein product [Bursaphelenchus xylophilus]
MFYLFSILVSVAFVKANFLEDVGVFFEPATLSNKEMAKLGLELFDAQWKKHGEKFTEDFKIPPVVAKVVKQLETPLQFASLALCPQCEDFVSDIQTKVRGDQDFPRWVAELTLPAAVCPLLFSIDRDLVPVCMVGGFGLSIFFVNSDPASVCAAIPLCTWSTGSPRSRTTTASHFTTTAETTVRTSATSASTSAASTVNE